MHSSLAAETDTHLAISSQLLRELFPSAPSQPGTGQPVSGEHPQISTINVYEPKSLVAPSRDGRDPQREYYSWPQSRRAESRRRGTRLG